MRIILLGAPGAGKGSVGGPLSKKLGIPVISTGDIFRQNISDETELGNTAKAYMDKGELVPDDLTVSIVEDRLLKDDCRDGFILDGFPRNIFQAEKLEEFLKENNCDIDMVLNVHLEDDRIIERVSNRMVCSQCKETYNLISKKPEVPGICDKCGGKLKIRDDDRPETVKKRLATYREQTKPLIEHYKEKGILVSINNDCSIEEGALMAYDSVMEFVSR